MLREEVKWNNILNKNAQLKAEKGEKEKTKNKCND